MYPVGQIVAAVIKIIFQICRLWQKCTNISDWKFVLICKRTAKYVGETWQQFKSETNWKIWLRDENNMNDKNHQCNGDEDMDEEKIVSLWSCASEQGGKVKHVNLKSSSFTPTLRVRVKTSQHRVLMDHKKNRTQRQNA